MIDLVVIRIILLTIMMIIKMIMVITMISMIMVIKKSALSKIDENRMIKQNCSFGKTISIRIIINFCLK